MPLWIQSPGHWAGGAEDSAARHTPVGTPPALVEVVATVFPVKGMPEPPLPTDVGELPLSWRIWTKREFWAVELCASSFVLSVIEKGYSLPFLSLPPRTWRRNSSVCVEYEDFVSQSIKELEKQGCVVEVKDRPWMVCGLSVDDSRDEPRLIYDARPLNDCLFIERFKYENVNTARDVLEQGGFLFQFDIKSAYPHVRVNPDHWGMLGLEWEGRWFVYTVLPFGLATAPFIFTKLMRVPLGYWRERGVRVMTMLDDGLGGAATVEIAQQHAELVRATLTAAGLTIHPVKSAWDPRPATQAFLGYRIDLHTGMIGIKIDRVAKVLRALIELRRDVHPTRRQLATLTGRIISMHHVLGNMSRALTRSLYALIYSVDGSWEQAVEWDEPAWREISFWREFAIGGGFDGQVPFWPDAIAVDIEAASDASDTALGVVLHAQSGDVESFAPLEIVDRARSSTWRELSAVLLGVQSFVRALTGRTVRWRTDNQAAAFILETGSRVQEIQIIARDIFLFCRAHAIHIVPLWIPRAENTQADALSRRVDLDDWGLSREAFARLAVRWGLPAIDLFADARNTLCALFMAYRPSPGAIAIDALASSWPDLLLYACPPWAMLSRVLARILRDRREMILIVPVWPRQPWWPLLCPDGVHSSLAVVDWHGLTRNDFSLGISGRPSFLLQSHWRFHALALRFAAFDAASPAFCLTTFNGGVCHDCTVSPVQAPGLARV